MTIVLLVFIILVLTSVIASVVIPMRFSDYTDTLPVIQTEGRVKGLKLWVRVTVCNTEFMEDTVNLTVKERFNLTYALLNPTFSSTVLSNYINNGYEILATKESCNKTWDIYEESDLNHDGVLTRREYADWLVLCATPWGRLREILWT